VCFWWRITSSWRASSERGLRGEGLLADIAMKGEDALWLAGSTPYE
jgi:hypothetical protein